MTRSRPDRSVYVMLLAAACGLLLVLPFVTTFNDFLAAGAIGSGLNGPIQALAAPEARMVVALLNLLHVRAGADGSHLVVYNAAGSMQTLYISWNCIGWQSVVLLFISLFTGLRGEYPLGARIQVVLIGLLGTALVNLARMTIVALLAAIAGYLPAVLFHDYGGTLMTIVWLFAFWALAHSWILPETAATEPGASA